MLPPPEVAAAVKKGANQKKWLAEDGVRGGETKTSRGKNIKRCGHKRGSITGVRVPTTRLVLAAVMLLI
jgi:hypothetical protein